MQPARAIAHLDAPWHHGRVISREMREGAQRLATTTCQSDPISMSTRAEERGHVIISRTSPSNSPARVPNSKQTSRRMRGKRKSRLMAAVLSMALPLALLATLAPVLLGASLRVAVGDSTSRARASSTPEASEGAASQQQPRLSSQDLVKSQGSLLGFNDRAQELSRNEWPKSGERQMPAESWQDLEQQRKRSQERRIKGALVRQLSNLIMNNEPAAIRRKLTSEQISGRLAAETSRLLLLRSRAPAITTNDATPRRGDASAEIASASAGDRLRGDPLQSTSSEGDETLEEGTQEDNDTVARAQDNQGSAFELERVASSGAIQTPTQVGYAGPRSKRKRHMSADNAWTVEASEMSSERVDEPAGTPGGEFLQDQDASEQAATKSDSEQQQQQSVTCSPDYEDQTIVIDHDNYSSLNEIIADGNNNLTAEQRQALLAGADISSLLQAQHGHKDGNESAAAAGQQRASLGPATIGQCVPAGSRMIEVITKVITPILFSIIIVVGLLGNIIVMLVILEDRQVERELTPTNLLILDLSLADLSFIIFCIPFTGWDYAVGHWVFGSLWCKFNQYLIVVCALSSIYTLVLMSCDRFMAIVYPIECISYRTSKNMLHAIIIKWIVILLIASPTILVHGLVDSPLGPDQYNCRYLSDQFNPLHFQVIFFITSYFLPLVLIFFLYLSLLRRLWCGQKPHGHKESTKMLESKKKVTWLVASIVLVFAACWCPIQIMLILMRLKTHKITATYVAVQVFAHTLGYMNSCVNPIVYAFASDTFNQSFKKSRLGRLCLTYLCCQPAHQSGNFGPNNHNHNNNNNHTHIHHFGAASTTNGHNFEISSANHKDNHLCQSPARRPNVARNSLQIATSASDAAFGRTPAGARSNKSLSNIFYQPEARQVAHLGGHETSSSQNMTGSHSARLTPSSPQPLTLEPRDRPTVKSPPTLAQPNPHQRRISASSSANQLVGREPTLLESEKRAHAGGQQVAKQQLVARIVVQSSGAGNSSSQVSHDCRPSELAHN